MKSIRDLCGPSAGLCMHNAAELLAVQWHVALATAGAPVTQKSLPREPAGIAGLPTREVPTTQSMVSYLGIGPPLALPASVVRQTALAGCP